MPLTEPTTTNRQAENRYSDRAMVPTRALQDQLFREMAARIHTSEPLKEGEEAGGDTATAAAQLLLAEPGGDGFVYYTRRPPGRNFPIYCRRPCAGGTAEGEEEVLLDQNTWPEYYQGQVLGDAKVSPRQGRLAFVLGSPEQGGRGWALFVQELCSGAWWTVEGGGWVGVGPSFEWGPALAAGEGRGTEEEEEEEVLYFTKVDEHGRPHEAWVAFLPLVGGGPGEGGRRGLSRPLQRVLRLDPVADRAFFLTATRTKDRRFVTLAATSKTTSEAWLLPGPEAPKADAAREEVCRPRLFCPRRPGIQYFVEHGGEAFFVVANDAPGGEYGLYTLSDDEVWGAVKAAEGGSASSSVAWRPYLSSSDSGGGDDSGIDGGSSIEDIDLFQGFCVLYTRSHATGAPALRVWDRRRPRDDAASSASSSHAPALPPAAAAGKLQPGLNQDYRAGRVRFSVTSPILPDVTYEYHMAARRLEELHRETLPGRPPLDPARRYACRRVLVPSWSGDEEGETATAMATATTIPLTLAHRRDVQPAQHGQGHHPVLLLGYGAYGVCLSTGFRPELLPLLERGWVLAFAHVRGGGEKGRAWHAQGKGAHKLNSLRDYLCCADWLVAEGWTRPGRIAGYGASSGALVVAGAAHRRPELFGSLVLKVPFLDLHRTMTDPTLPLTVHEYDEWGDPRQDRSVAARLAALSPYDTLPAEARTFPPTLLLASLADDRVKGWEAAKYAAKVRGVRLVPGNGDARCGSHPEVLLRMERERGHEAPLTHAEMLQEAAFEQAFMLTRMGADVPVGVDKGEDDVRTGRRRNPGGPARRRSNSSSSQGRRYLAPVPPLAFW